MLICLLYLCAWFALFYYTMVFELIFCWVHFIWSWWVSLCIVVCFYDWFCWRVWFFEDFLSWVWMRITFRAFLPLFLYTVQVYVDLPVWSYFFLPGFPLAKWCSYVFLTFDAVVWMQTCLLFFWTGYAFVLINCPFGYSSMHVLYIAYDKCNHSWVSGFQQCICLLFSAGVLFFPVRKSDVLA